jgi:5-methylcytosine-specific restriction endonuclease McrA
MSEVLRDAVLVLNRNWQAIDVTDVETAFCNICRGVCTAIDTDSMKPVNLAEWLALPVAHGQKSIGTIHGQVRVPTVIAAVNYAKMPKKRPKLCARTVAERDKNRCQYTGKLLKSHEGNLDHVVPRSRGGKDTWENLVWAAKEVNTKKADRLPQEAGLTLLSAPKAPKEVPAMLSIKPRAGYPEWNHFLVTAE